MSADDNSMGTIETVLAVWFFAAMLLVQKSCDRIEDWKISRQQHFLDTHEAFIYGVSLDDEMICFSSVKQYDKWCRSHRKERITQLPTTFNKSRWDDWKGHQMFLYRWGDEIWSLNTLQGVKFFRCDDGEHEAYLDLFREQGVTLKETK